MPTNIQIKAAIDADIINKTLPSSVTNTVVGARVKDVVDYVVQEVAVINNTASVLQTNLQSDITGINNEITLLQGGSIVKVLKTTITQAQILQLFTTPIAILTSTTTGKAKIPLNILCKRNGIGTNYTIASNQFALSVNGGSTITFNMFNNILTGTTPVSYTTLSANVSSHILTGIDNEVYKLGCYTSNPTGGTGNMDVYVTYLEITL